MTEEIKNQENEQCLCKSKAFRKFLLIAGGTFVGVYCALSLFAALHRPPMLPPMPFERPMMQHCPCHAQHFDRGNRGEFHRKPPKGDFAKKPPMPAPKKFEED